MSCGCNKPVSNSSQSSNTDVPEINSFGTVLDFKIGLKGAVTQKSDGRITIKSKQHGTEVDVELIEGIPGIFEGVEISHVVFCAVLVTRKLEEHRIEGICFLLINFNSKAYLERKPTHERFLVDTPAGAAANEFFKTAIDANFNSTASPACIVAALKAASTPDFLTKAQDLVKSGYAPVSFTCVPGMPGRYTGFIFVLFKFLNLFGRERIISVAISLRTFGDVKNLPVLLAGEPKPEIDEVEPEWCGPWCVACKVACRGAQGVCIAGCATFSGPAAVLCIAACVEAGNYCYRKC